MVAQKTVTYSVMHFVVAFLVAYAVSGDLKIAMGISIIEPIVQTICYYFHEKFWLRKSGRSMKFSFRAC